MTREEAKDYIIHNPHHYFKPAKKKGYICPICGNGSGNDGDGILLHKNDNTGTHFKCFKCNFYGDVIDYIGEEYGITDPSGKFEKAYEIYGIDIENDTIETVRIREKKINHNQAVQKEKKMDYSEFLNECINHLQCNEKAMKYLEDRGLTKETISKFHLGFFMDSYGVPRVVSPYNTKKTYYIGRRIDDKNEIKYLKPKTEEAGLEPLWNGEILKKAREPIFIVESIFCGMSIDQAGGKAVALNTTGEPNSFKREFESLKEFNGVFVVCLDKDLNNAGQEGQKKLVRYLKEHDAKYIEYDLSEECKDPNDLLKKDSERFYRNVQAAIIKANKLLYGDLDQSNYDYILNGLNDDIRDFSKSKDRKTGYSNLDELNGLYNGLYVIGAVSSLGKTSFTYQLGDQLAQGGEKVLYFSLEQSRLELLTKSISRITAQTDYKNAVTGLEIRKGFKNDTVNNAIKAYEPTAKNMQVIECNFDANVNYIKNYVEKYIKYIGVKPVVIIDYLQIIPPVNVGEQTKDAVDYNVRALKKMQSENDLLVFVISSINRSNYLAPIDFESFKESGGIEYTADVVWGLQLEVLYSELFTKEKQIIKKREAVKEAKKEHPRKIVLECLKNRYGVSNYSVGFTYHSRYDLFIPNTEFSPVDSTPFDEELAATSEKVR